MKSRGGADAQRLDQTNKRGKYKKKPDTLLTCRAKHPLSGLADLGTVAELRVLHGLKLSPLNSGSPSSFSGGKCRKQRLARSFISLTVFGRVSGCSRSNRKSRDISNALCCSYRRLIFRSFLRGKNAIQANLQPTLSAVHPFPYSVRHSVHGRATVRGSSS